jgi:hypothetical protein
MFTEYLNQILLVTALPLWASVMYYVISYEKKAAYEHAVQKPWY